MNATRQGSRRGSEWRRWDPHLHAPGTLLSDRFPKTWDGFVDAVNAATPTLEVIGVTDYFCIGTYRKARRLWLDGRFPNVSAVFPNVELRLGLETAKAKAVNIHLLFSPDDPDHEAEIERVLAHLVFRYREREYRCTASDLIALGRASNPALTEDEPAMSAGANQFKVTLADLRGLFERERWMRKNCLVAVAGSSNDGTAGLQEDSSFKSMREEVEAFADIIFAATPSQRRFWLGQSEGFDRAFIEHTYRHLKPCLHGSDAHEESRVGSPDMDRFCWIKGDLTFETLRQAVLEPATRVWIAATPPTHQIPSLALTNLTMSGAPWFSPSSVELNSGLVAVIGARGSGKTALVEIIARGALSERAGLGDSSFLRRASTPKDMLGNGAVSLEWRDGASAAVRLVPDYSFGYEDASESGVCYLSQQFVSQLCSSDGLARELRDEIERVVFEATEPTERLGAQSFSAYATILLDPIRQRRSELQDQLRTLSSEIVSEQQMQAKLGALTKQSEELKKQREQSVKDLAKLVPKGAEVRAKQLSDLEMFHSSAQAKIEKLKARKQALVDLAAATDLLSGPVEQRRLSDMKKRHMAAGLDDATWQRFTLVFAGDVAGAIAGAKKGVDAAISLATIGDPKVPIDVQKPPDGTWPLNTLRSQLDLAKKAVGIDAEQQKKYDTLRKKIQELDVQLQRVSEDIGLASGASERAQHLIGDRRTLFAAIVDTIVEEEGTLGRLYEPLKGQLATGEGALKRLEFFVRRRVDLDGWVDQAERNIFDLRRSRFRGHGTLKAELSVRLLPSLLEGTSQAISEAMETFRSECAEELKGMMPPDMTAEEKVAWTQSMATWLYATDHVTVEYGIRYDGTILEQLSPGTRGIVLLLLYLVIDKHDTRPLIIDQPEENLDPKSVYEELVPHIRDARQRRQVIIVTHNANLVVNTDADQVIVATAKVIEDGHLPQITYTAGSLENDTIREEVCEVLEGGRRAFLERERRYRLRWGESVEDVRSS